MYEDLTHNDLVSIIESYKKRFALIKDDVNAIYHSMELNEHLKTAMSSNSNLYTPSVCLMNIDIACDLQSDECFEWELYSNL